MKTTNRLIALALSGVIAINTLVQAQWVQQGENWYLKDPNNKTLYGWQQSGPNNWYYMDQRGIMQTGFIKQNDKFYYLNKKEDGVEGLMRTGWYQEPKEKNWYFFDTRKESLGIMASNQWVWIDGYCYYFDATGKMAQGTTVNGYQVDNDGHWSKDGVAQYESGKGIPGKFIDESTQDNADSGYSSGSSENNNKSQKKESANIESESDETDAAGEKDSDKRAIQSEEHHATEDEHKTKDDRKSKGDDADNFDVTRYEWIAYLMDATGDELSETVTNYYDDIDSNTQEGLYVLNACSKGIIPPVYDWDADFNGDEPATREFAAVTTINAMQYQTNKELSKEDKKLLSDFSSLQYPIHDTIAVKLEYIYPDEKDAFAPDEYLTSEQAQTILDKIEEVNYRYDHIGENEIYDAVYKDSLLKDELEDETIYKLEETGEDEYSLTIPVNDNTKLIKKDTVFMLPQTIPGTDGYPLKAKKISKNSSEEYFLISAVAPKFEEVYEELHIEAANTTGKIGKVKPAEGVTATYVDENGIMRTVTADDDDRVIANTLNEDDLLSLLKTEQHTKQHTKQVQATPSSIYLEEEDDTEEEINIATASTINKSDEEAEDTTESDKEIIEKLSRVFGKNIASNSTIEKIDDDHVKVHLLDIDDFINEGAASNILESKALIETRPNFLVDINVGFLEITGTVYYDILNAGIIYDQSGLLVNSYSLKVDSLVGYDLTIYIDISHNDGYTEGEGSEWKDAEDYIEQLLAEIPVELIPGAVDIPIKVYLKFDINVGITLVEKSTSILLGVEYENGEIRNTTHFTAPKLTQVSITGIIGPQFGIYLRLGSTINTTYLEIWPRVIVNASLIRQPDYNTLCADIGLKIEVYITGGIFKDTPFDILKARFIFTIKPFESFHVEDVGIVPECSYAPRSYKIIVSDESHTPISGAKVTIRDDTKIFEYHTDKSGVCYVYIDLPGDYSVTAEADGYETFKVNNYRQGIEKTWNSNCKKITLKKDKSTVKVKFKKRASNYIVGDVECKFSKKGEDKVYIPDYDSKTHFYTFKTRDYGTYTMTAQKEGFKTITKEFKITEDSKYQEEEFEMEDTTHHVVRIHPKDEERCTLGNATLQLTNTETGKKYEAEYDKELNGNVIDLTELKNDDPNARYAMTIEARGYKSKDTYFYKTNTYESDIYIEPIAPLKVILASKDNSKLDMHLYVEKKDGEELHLWEGEKEYSEDAEVQASMKKEKNGDDVTTIYMPDEDTKYGYYLYCSDTQNEFDKFKALDLNIKVYRGEMLLDEFDAPNSYSGNTYHVFDYDPKWNILHSQHDAEKPHDVRDYYTYTSSDPDDVKEDYWSYVLKYDADKEMYLDMAIYVPDCWEEKVDRKIAFYRANESEATDLGGNRKELRIDNVNGGFLSKYTTENAEYAYEDVSANPFYEINVTDQNHKYEYNSNALSNSNMILEIYRGSTLWHTIPIRRNTPGSTWYACWFQPLAPYRYSTIIADTNTLYFDDTYNGIKDGKSSVQAILVWDGDLNLQTEVHSIKPDGAEYVASSAQGHCPYEYDTDGQPIVTTIKRGKNFISTMIYSRDDGAKLKFYVYNASSDDHNLSASLRNSKARVLFYDGLGYWGYIDVTGNLEYKKGNTWYAFEYDSKRQGAYGFGGVDPWDIFFDKE